MKIFIGADHRGFEDKKLIVDYLKSLGHEVVDLGDNRLNPNDDFPLYATKVAEQVLMTPGSRGILLCGSGQGMVMAANRFKGIRASICSDSADAHSSRNDDDANVLCLSADKLNWPNMEAIISVWLNTDFAGAPRFIRRIEELDKLGG